MKTYCPTCDAQTERVCFVTVRVPHFAPGTYIEAAKAALDRYEYEAPSRSFWDSVCDVCGEKYSLAWRKGFQDYDRVGDTLSLAEAWACLPDQESIDYEDYRDGWRVSVLDRDESIMGWDL